MKEVRDWAEGKKAHLCHWFTVDDLNHLRRGGRIPAATALIGTLLGIKPILIVDSTGHLVSTEKVRGRKASIIELVDKMEKFAFSPKEQTVFISHGDCLEDAEKLEQLIRDRFGTESIYINFIGPVIGAHSGPGTLALFFLGNRI